MARAAFLSSGSEPPDVRFMNATASAFAVIAVLLIASAALLWLSRQPFFAIRVIRIEGDVTHNSASTIRANAAPRLAGNFLTIDLGAVRRAFEAVPWVRHAVVQRVWPNRLRVRLEEHRPVALWGGGDANADELVNSFGEVFEANVGDVEDDALPTLEGPDGSSAHVLAMLQRLDPVFAPLRARIDALSLSSRGSWKATLDNGAVVEIGRGDDDAIVARTARFVATVGQVTGRYERPLEFADLRHTDGYAVRLKGVSTTTPAGTGDRAAAKK
ncbi:MAG TPA: cell division protein FtsQ/DivIB [Caldimonas sp.]|nr:cell division protein FtsQ/DivIB [Caldimonas sp.]